MGKGETALAVVQTASDLDHDIIQLQSSGKTYQLSISANYCALELHQSMQLSSTSLCANEQSWNPAAQHAFAIQFDDSRTTGLLLHKQASVPDFTHTGKPFLATDAANTLLQQTIVRGFKRSANSAKLAA